ncbi:MAG TPA: translation elongation factor Ts [Calditrichaeota bacterium]|nr:translation elongation factor Ts [Calditrichota bacterium]
MAEITAAMVKELRDKSGAGMMDCKKALQEADGDFEKAMEFLRKKGIAKAAKRADREANEGIVAAYIHPGSKLGVLVEVNCETDFVANTDDFKEFAKNVAMHVAASNPLAIGREDLDSAVMEKEKEIFKEQALASGKPENIVEKIVQGRLEKYYAEVCLLEQPFVKDPDKSIQDLLTETIAKLGENVSIKRFARFRIGE